MAILFVTGTDTGVGKTVVTAALVRCLIGHGANVAALKPACSGGRTDARALRLAANGALTLAEVNPWHFRAPLAPPLAAARAGRRLRLTPMARHVQRLARRFDLLLVEGAGGLLSPLAHDGDNRDLMRQLRARPLIVVPNRLGAINQALLVRAALTARERRIARWVLVAPRRISLLHRLNTRELRARLGAARVVEFPFLRRGGQSAATRRALGRLAAALRAPAR